MIKFVKRRLGNTLSRPFGILAGVFGLAQVISGVNIVGLLFYSAFIIVGLTFAFGKEMTEIDFQRKTLNQYYQILFVKFNNPSTLPNIDYLLIWDFCTKESYSLMTDDIDYYEISFVTVDQKKIVLALLRNEKNVIRLIDKFKVFTFLKIIDNTHSKILSRIKSGS